MDPEVVAQLDAIDATLAGQPVDPAYAELAELALLLAAARPEVEPGFAHSLDGRMQRRFDDPHGAIRPLPGPQNLVGRDDSPPRRSWSRPSFRWKLGIASLAAGIAAAAVAVGVATDAEHRVLPEQAARPSVSATTGAAAPGARSASSGVARAPVAPAPSAGLGAPTATGAGAAAPQPAGNGRKIVQSAQLALSAAPNRIDDVAQETFDVIGRENGIVRRSSVTATGGTDGSAEFDLSVPSSALQATMTALSGLQYAHVASRTDTSQDVNDRYVALTRRLADARALRTGLLRQLANATTQQQIDSLRARIRDAEAAIAAGEANLRGLNRAVNFSEISMTVSAVPVPLAHGGGSSFTLGKAAHSAARVLTVAAGVALIALAVLVPVGLIVALALWIGGTLRRRRREHALDMA